jgi:Amidohydrolase family
LGSDSPLTSCGDLLDEIRFAVQHCGLSPQRIYSMVTESPAAMLRFPHGNGSLRISAPGDAIAVRDTGLSPAEALCSLSFANVELVLRNGHPFLASDELMRRLPTAKREGLEPLSIAGTIRWLRAPVSEMLREAESVLGIDQVMLGGKQVSHANRHSGYIAQNPPKGLTHAG